MAQRPAYANIAMAQTGTPMTLSVDLFFSFRSPYSYLALPRVLKLVAEGYSGTEIAEQLVISPKTVDTYRERIMQKLGVRHRYELVKYALRKGMLKAELKPVLDAVKFFKPLRLMVRSAKVAKPPPSVAMFVVPLSVPKPLVKAIVTVTPRLGTLLPKLSFNWTLTEGAITAPAVASVGCCTKTTWLAPAGKIVNELLSTGVAGALLAVSVFDPTRLAFRPANVATPPASVD